jgi:hypothetical protein
MYETGIAKMSIRDKQPGSPRDPQVLRIHDILVLIRIRESRCASRSGCVFRSADPDPHIFIIDLLDTNEKPIKKSVLQSTKIVKLKFSLIFLLINRMIRIRIQSRIRIQEAQIHVDLDPQH